MLDFQSVAPAIELKDATDDGTVDEVAIVTKALDDLSSSVDARVKAIEEKALAGLTARLDKIETTMNRPAITRGAADPSIEAKAFANVMRFGEGRLDADERKALTVGTDAQAGYLAPVEFASELIKLLREFSPVRQYARVTSIGGKEVKFPRRTTSPVAYWVDENEDRAASQPAYEQIALTSHELAVYCDVSNQLLEDAAFDIEGELRGEFAEAFAAKEGAAFVSGDGTKKPFGLLTSTGIADFDVAGATITADDLIAAYHALPGPFARRGAWMMNRTTLGALRTLKDGNGRFLLADPINETAATTILGLPVVEAVDMPDVASGASPIVFGDLTGYRIVDRVGVSVLRDPFSRATNGETRFHARKRVGAGVTHPDRFLKLTIA